MKFPKYILSILVLLIGLVTPKESLESPFSDESEREHDSGGAVVTPPASSSFLIPRTDCGGNLRQKPRDTSFVLFDGMDAGLDERPSLSLRHRLRQDHVFRGLNKENATSDGACADQTDCDSCYAKSTWCHWCEKQNACHSKGSFYGCFSGSQCTKNHTVDPDDQHGCAAHQTCQECSTASRFCHWCAHDQACHSVGSVYGCTVGIDCFSNDRCKRKTPQRIKQHISPDQFHALPIAIVMAVAVFVCCCASICFCVCKGVKGAYDDLADLSAVPGRDTAEPLLGNHNGNSDDDPVVIVPAVEEGEDEADNDDDGNRGTAVGEESFVSAVEEGEAIAGDTGEQAENGDVEGDIQPDNEYNGAAELDPLLGEESTVSINNVRRSIRPRRPRHMQRLYNGCRLCYVFIIILMGTIMFCSIWFYPKIPVYNICNDNVAWKSIIKSMESLHTEADIEILGSISNPNHISAALVNGTGTFSYKGKFVGTFTIPPFTAQAMSITDFILIAHLTPGAWDGIAIAKDFSLGKLVLSVNASAVLRIPTLADMTFEGGRDDIIVYVNEIQDRSLCACPSWDEARNHTDVAPGLSLPELPSVEQD